MNIVDTVYSDRDSSNAEQDVVSVLETQKLRALNTELPYSPRRFIMQRPPCFHHVYADTYHATATNPTYTVRLIDKDNNVTTANLSVTADKRTQSSGFLVNSDECVVRVLQSSKTADSLRSIIVAWTEF